MPEEQTTTAIKPETAKEEKVEKIEENLEHIYAERLKAKAEELGAIEAAIDKKISEFKDFVQKTQLAGRSVSIPVKTKEQEHSEAVESEYQKWRKAARGI